MNKNPKATSQPLVSLITPVYNGEKHLGECIESALAQTHQNWEYIIVNNCSTDRSLDIAKSYARKDTRIRIHNNQEFVGSIENHNIAFRQISPQSKYCKVLHADDWLFPECLTQMVKVAEENPSVGIVGSYSLHDSRVKCDGIPYPSTVVTGREICRLTLRRELYLFLSPTSLLIRSNLIHNVEAFYNKPQLYADVEACYEVLQQHDFGFVHQVLTYIRIHNESTSSVVYLRLGTIILANLSHLIKYGPVYLDTEEYNLLLKRRIKVYYRFLARNIFRLRDPHFRQHHLDTLKNLGYPLSNIKLMVALAFEALNTLLHPKQAARNVTAEILKFTAPQFNSLFKQKMRHTGTKC